MLSLNFTVTETEVALKEEPDALTSGNLNQIKCNFDLSPAFDNLIVRAVFNGYFVNVVDGVCFAPMLDSGKCTVGVYGYVINSENQYETIISPAPTTVLISNGSFNKIDVEADNPLPTELDRYCSLIKELIDEVKTQNNIFTDGKLLGIETIFNEADYYAFNNRYKNIGENEYAVEVVPYDIQIDDWTLGKAIGILTKDDYFELADVDWHDFENLKKYLENQINTLTPPYVQITENTDISTLLPDIIYQVNNSNVKYTSIMMNGDSSRSFWLANGETFYISTQGNGKKGLTLRTNLGYYHIPDINEPDWSKYVTVTKGYVDEQINNALSSIVNGNEVAY